MNVLGNREPVVHPLSILPGGHDSGPAQVGEMPGNLRLGGADYLREIADAYFLFRHETEKPQSGSIRESAEKLIQGNCLVHGAWHENIIYALTNTSSRNNLTAFA